MMLTASRDISEGILIAMATLTAMRSVLYTKGIGAQNE